MKIGTRRFNRNEKVMACVKLRAHARTHYTATNTVSHTSTKSGSIIIIYNGSVAIFYCEAVNIILKKTIFNLNKCLPYYLSDKIMNSNRNNPNKTNNTNLLWTVAR